MFLACNSSQHLVDTIGRRTAVVRPYFDQRAGAFLVPFVADRQSKTPKQEIEAVFSNQRICCGARSGRFRGISE